jgi:hypothetical protein
MKCFKRTIACRKSFQAGFCMGGYFDLEDRGNILAQDRYRWRAIVNTVMNLRVP